MDAYRVRYQTIELGEFDIHLRTLRDKNQFADPLGEAAALGISSAQWSLFGVVWDSSRVLATEMASFSIAGKRILEVGCGIGLSSVLLNKRHADITATDYHPEAGAFLAENTRLNGGAKIPFLRTAWTDMSDGLGRFDLIIGSDLLYEKEHAELLSAFLARHANTNCEIIVVDPGRGKHASFSKHMVAHGFSHSQRKPDCSEFLSQPFKGQVLRYWRSDTRPQGQPESAKPLV